MNEVASKYSVVISPPPAIIEFIAEQYKKPLEKEIGWYNSINAKAHITIFEKHADADELVLLIKSIHHFCAQQFPQEVQFTRFDTFPSGAFFIEPDKPSKRYLDTLIKSFIKFQGETPSVVHAHMSIGRKLDASKIVKALALFSAEQPNILFFCDNIALRKLDEGKKQFEIVETFPLKGHPPLTLF